MDGFALTLVVIGVGTVTHWFMLLLDKLEGRR